MRYNAFEKLEWDRVVLGSDERTVCFEKYCYDLFVELQILGTNQTLDVL